VTTSVIRPWYVCPMKNQYFGDKHDFYKYDLLLELMGSSLGFEQLVLIWMLTPDDPRGDGEITGYKAGQRDESLHDWLQTQHHHRHRDVGRLADCPGFAEAAWRFMPVLDLVPDDPDLRARYFELTAGALTKPSLVFVDPDNGFLVKTAKRAAWPKYVDYPDVAKLHGAMGDESLLLVFQYVERFANRKEFYDRKLRELEERCGISDAAVIAPDGEVAYVLIAESAARLAQVVDALKPYIAKHKFKYPQDATS